MKCEGPGVSGTSGGGAAPVSDPAPVANPAPVATPVTSAPVANVTPAAPAVTPATPAATTAPAPAVTTAAADQKAACLAAISTTANNDAICDELVRVNVYRAEHGANPLTLVKYPRILELRPSQFSE